jgi:hypothetical protein
VSKQAQESLLRHSLLQGPQGELDVVGGGCIWICTNFSERLIEHLEGRVLLTLLLNLFRSLRCALFNKLIAGRVQQIQKSHRRVTSRCTTFVISLFTNQARTRFYAHATATATAAATAAAAAVSARARFGRATQATVIQSL